MKVKAFIFSGNRQQYQYFLSENHLSRYEYPCLDDINWNGHHDVDIIRIGTFYENSRLLDMLPHIENYLKGTSTAKNH